MVWSLARGIQNLCRLGICPYHRHKYLKKGIYLSGFEASFSTSSMLSVLEGTTDKYNGVKVNIADVPLDMGIEEFQALLKDSLHKWRLDNMSAVWLHVPIVYGKFIPAAAEEGFQYHHAEYGSALLKLWLNKAKLDVTPQFATHQVGVSGIAVKEETREILLVQDRHRSHTNWKFPGGLSDLGEDIGDTAVREVYEETGVRCEFASVLAFRQQHDRADAFGRSDIYVVCRLRPLTFDIKPCSDEIQECQWLLIDDVLRMANIAPMTKRLTNILAAGLNEGFHTIDITPSEMISPFNNQLFKMYSRSLLQSNDSQKST